MGKVIDKNDFWFIKNNPITKVGVFPYLGKQISPECEPDKVYYVLRPKEELFKKETLNSLRLLPLVDNHTMIGKDFTAPEEKGIDGVLGDDVSHDNDTIYNDLKLFSNKIKDEISNGKKELSLGYFCRYDKQPGTYKGQRYDFIQRDIIGNHLALVDKGRMGSDVRVYDSKDTMFAMDSFDIAFDFNENHNPKNGQFASGKEEKIKETKKIAQEKLKDIKPIVTITGKEFEGNTIEEKRANAQKFFDDNFKDQKFKNKNWGKEIKVLSSDKTFSQTASEDKINSFKYLDKMLENAFYLTSAPDTKKRPNVKQWHYLASKITNSKRNDEDEIIVFSVREDNNGNVYYNHTINEKEADDVSSQDSVSRTPSPASDNSITDKNQKVNIYFCGEDIQEEVNNTNQTEYKTKQGESKMAEQNKNEKPVLDEDKRKLIDEIGGMLKEKLDEELWRTVIGKVEKVAYNASEAGKGADEDEQEGKEGKEGKDPKKTTTDKCGKDGEGEGGEHVKKEDDKDKKEDAKGMDEGQIIAMIARKNKLAKAIENIVGTFDHSEMTELQVAKYACDKLELGACDGQEIATLKGYLKAAANKKPVIITYSQDKNDFACDKKDEGFESFVNRK